MPPGFRATRSAPAGFRPVSWTKRGLMPRDIRAGGSVSPSTGSPPAPSGGVGESGTCCRDPTGYGWCLRKHDYLNVGFGRLDRHGLPKATAEFVGFLKRRRKIPRDASWRWHGHAYLLYEMRRRRVLDAGVLLIGDAAGLAYSQSGEGIRPAIESGLLAASTIIEANGCYTRDRLELYQPRCRARFDG